MQFELLFIFIYKHTRKEIIIFDDFFTWIPVEWYSLAKNTFKKLGK